MNTRLNRRKLLKLMGASAALACGDPAGLLDSAARAAAESSAGGADSAERPNILYIFTDQQHWKMLSCTGNPHVKTPAMDSLTRTGARFDRTYAANPVCSPSRTSLFTGHYPSVSEMQSNADTKNAKIPESILHNALGNLFRRAGYETAYGGKVHLPVSLADIGFDEISRDEREELGEVAAEFIRRKHDKPFLLVTSFINPHDICFQAINHFRESKQGENDPSLNWLKGNPTDAQRKEPAKANISPDKLRKGINQAQTTLAEALKIPEGVTEEEFYKTLAPPLPENYEVPVQEPEAITTEIIDKEQPFRGYARRTFTDEQWRLHRWAYARLTERVDAEIARVLEALRETGLDKNTVVVFSSDHGDMDAAHRLEHKSVLYEESSRVPFIVSYPGETRPGLVDDEHLVSNGLDLIPTLLDYAGIPSPAGLPGRSVRALAAGRRPQDWRRELVVEGGFGRAVYQGNLKYTVYSTGRNREFLVDLERDPGELENLAGHPDHQAGLTELRTALRRLVEQTGDPYAPSYLVS